MAFLQVKFDFSYTNVPKKLFLELWVANAGPRHNFFSKNVCAHIFVNFKINSWIGWLWWRAVARCHLRFPFTQLEHHQRNFSLLRTHSRTFKHFKYIHEHSNTFDTWLALWHMWPSKIVQYVLKQYNCHILNSYLFCFPDYFIAHLRCSFGRWPGPCRGLLANLSWARSIVQCVMTILWFTDDWLTCRRVRLFRFMYLVLIMCVSWQPFSTLKVHFLRASEQWCCRIEGNMSGFKIEQFLTRVAMGSLKFWGRFLSSQWIKSWTLHPPHHLSIFGSGNSTIWRKN